jgi:hypothetical protein
LQTKTRRKTVAFIGFVGVICVISAGASGYFFHRRMQQVLQHDASMIKSEGLMLGESGEQLERLAAVVSSYAQSESALHQVSSHQPALQKVADEVRKHGEDLVRYGRQLIQDMQTQEPQDALATIADVRLLAPEKIHTIKEQEQTIQDLEISALKLRSRLQELQFQLATCMTQANAKPYSTYGYQEKGESSGTSQADQ